MSNIHATSSGFFTSCARRLAPLAAVCALLFTMGGEWSVTKPAAAQPRANVASVSAAAQKSSDDLDQDKPSKPSKRAGKELAGKLNLNTATEEQLQLLPTVGPSKAERIVSWRKKNGGFKRTADLRRVKGFGYKTLKKLEPYLDIKGETTLSER
ncbi:MAG: helix-hairpin-helix domain-containing protein [Kofleriaceae bacterium]|nr:helix-hairpin-helix domain-containing protein [Kofleriaceae bacterium]